MYGLVQDVAGFWEHDMSYLKMNKQLKRPTKYYLGSAGTPTYTATDDLLVNRQAADNLVPEHHKSNFIVKFVKRLMQVKVAIT